MRRASLLARPRAYHLKEVARLAGAMPGPEDLPAPEASLPVLPATSQFAEISRPVGGPREIVPPRAVKRGVVVFDLDGTILDDISLICTVAADVMAQAFGTPEEEARVHYLATTGMPFEAQLAQLYPTAPAALRASTARTFHQRKVVEAYAKAHPFPEVPKLLNTLDRDGWTLAVATGAETEMADLMLEREGLRYWFEGVLGSGEGTKREHLAEYPTPLPRRADVPGRRLPVRHGSRPVRGRRDAGGPSFAAPRMDAHPGGPQEVGCGLGRLHPIGPSGYPQRAGIQDSEIPDSKDRGSVEEGVGPGPRVSQHGGGPRAALNPGRGIHSPPG